jgi:metallo-beta-lactamase class B
MLCSATDVEMNNKSFLPPLILATTLTAPCQQAPDHPGVILNGQTFTPRSILARNMGMPEEQTTAFPPHKIIGNIYYVGTRKLSSFLIVTPQGNILIDSTYERNVRTIQKSVEQLGFKFSDIKILLGNHAHGDHQEGDALVKELSGAQVMAMAEDLPELRAIKPGGKEHPVDRVLHDGESITLGGTTLVAHLTAGHTHGATLFTAKVPDGEKMYDVVFYSSLRSPAVLTPKHVAEFSHSFDFVHGLACEVPLGDHPAEYDMEAKYAKLSAGGPNPFIDVAGCKKEAYMQEAMFHAILAEQNSPKH